MRTSFSEGLSLEDRDELVLSKLPAGLRVQIEGFVEAAVHRLPGRLCPERLHELASLADERGEDLDSRGDEPGSLTGYAMAASFRRIAAALGRLN
jgi:hypothetical protein